MKDRRRASRESMAWTREDRTPMHGYAATRERHGGIREELPARVDAEESRKADWAKEKPYPRTDRPNSNPGHGAARNPPKAGVGHDASPVDAPITKTNPSKKLVH